MRRGFKAEAERLSMRIRQQIGVSEEAPINVKDLARHLNVEVFSASDLVSDTRLRQLEDEQPGAFSAATFHLPNGRMAAVYNPLVDPARTKSDITHELAHVLLDHKVRDLQQIAGHTFLTCDPEQEEEANWLAGCLLLPRSLLLKEAYVGADAATIAQRYGVTLSMARFRLNTSGVLLQARRTGQVRRRSPGRHQSAEDT